MLGIINLNKPTGKTSHDMVALVRRLFGIRRVGHAGTLDPEASGVLPILVGKATLLSDMLTEKRKVYCARVKLGVETDSYDMTGKVVSRCDKRPSEEEIQKACQRFLGKISQFPPMYSAVKVGGKKLYELARRGIEIERKERIVEIYEIRPYDFAEDSFSLEIACSKGTYIRSLCHDLGKVMGTCAAMSALVRLQSGPFRIEEALSPEDLEEALKSGKLERLLLPIESILSVYPAVKVSSQQGIKIKNGIRLRPEQLGIEQASLGDCFRIYEEETLLCLSRVVRGEGSLVLAIEKNFYEPSMSID